MRKAIPKSLRLKVVSRFDGKCGYCGHKPERLQIDHVKPLQYGGTDDESNLMPACQSCNNYKMTHDMESFRREITEQVQRGRQRQVNFRLAERFGLITVTGKPVIFYFEAADED